MKIPKEKNKEGVIFRGDYEVLQQDAVSFLEFGKKGDKEEGNRNIERRSP